MTEPSSWIQLLAQLLAETRVTDGHGRGMGLEEGFTRALELLREVRAAGRKVLVLGNGGSAAIAAHVQTDLAHSAGVRALVLHEPSLLTAQANDHGYEQAFRNLTALWVDSGDLMISVSSSGRSPNILLASATAKERGCGLLTFSGFGPENPLRALGDLNFHVSSRAYGAVESAHAVLLHQLTDRLLESLTEGGQA